MTADLIQSRLNKLNHSSRPRRFRAREVELVYWYCKFAPDEATEIGLRERVARIMGVSVTTVYNHLAPIQDKLEIEDLRFVPEEVCQVLVPLIDELPTEHRTIEDKDKHGRVFGTDVLVVPSFKKLVWPHEFPIQDDPINQLFTASSTIAIPDSEESSEEASDPGQRAPDAIQDIVGPADEEDAQETEASPIGGVIPIEAGREPDAIEEFLSRQQDAASPPTPQSDSSDAGSNIRTSSPERNWWTVLIPIAVVVGLLLWGVSWFAGRNRPEEQIASADRELINQLVDSTVQAFPPIIQTRIVREIVEVTVPPEIIEQTRVVEVIQTVPVLQTVVIPQTVQVEVPVTVEVTPEPTALPTITPLPVNIVVTEDFSDFTLDPAFEVVSGEPQFADGRMYVPSQVVLKVGDETWRNYSLSFDALSLSGALSGAATSTVMYMTVRDSRSSKLRFSHGNISWWSGAWSYLGGNGDFVGLVDTDVNWTGHTEVVVEENFIYHTDESGVTKTIPNTYAESGGFALTLNHLWVDNLRVERND